MRILISILGIFYFFNATFFFFLPVVAHAETAKYAGQCTSSATGAKVEFGTLYFEISKLSIKSTTGEIIQPFASCKDVPPKELYGQCLCGLIGTGIISSVTDLIPGVSIYTDPSGQKYAFKTLTSTQADCSVFSATFQKIVPAGTYLAKGCAWKLPEGYKPDDGGITKKIEWKPVAPNLAINIPGFKGFSELKPQDEAGQKVVYISYLAEYLGILYRFLIFIVGIIAVVMIIFSGFQWILAGGNSAQTASARERIEGAIIGLLLALGSYVVLYIINPDLVKFKSLRIQIIQTVDLENSSWEEQSPNGDSAAPITSTKYDDLFKKFSACSGIDWRIYKTISFRESNFNASTVNKSGFTGLFQTRPEYCKTILTKVGWGAYCDSPGIKDPAVNVAMISAGFFPSSKARIESLCPSADVRTKAILLYYGNAVGLGGMRSAVKERGCNLNDPAWKSAKKRPADSLIAAIDRGFKMGVTSLYVSTDNTQCPYKNGSKPSDLVK